MRTRTTVLIAAISLSGSIALPARAQSGGVYAIVSSTLDGGGGTSTGGVYAISGTIGQPDASNALTGGAYSLTGGFWAGIVSELRGDADGSNARSVSDVLYLINHLFAGGPAPGSACRGDADSSGATNVADVLFLINFLFAGGPTPGPC